MRMSNIIDFDFYKRFRVILSVDEDEIDIFWQIMRDTDLKLEE